MEPSNIKKVFVIIKNLPKVIFEIKKIISKK